MSGKTRFSVKLIYQDELTKTFSLCELNILTNEIVSFIGIVNYDIPNDATDDESNKIIEEKLKALSKDRNTNLHKINKDFNEIIRSFQYKA